MTRNRRWNQSAIVNNVANVGDWDMFWSSDIPFFSTVNIFSNFAFYIHGKRSHGVAKQLFLGVV